MSKIFTSEFVSPGHPDKLMDSIAEDIVDAYLNLDSNARVAVDGLVKGTEMILAGEITSIADVDIKHRVPEVIREIGYDPDISKFNWASAKINTVFSKQSPDIAQGVNRSTGLGAGDIGIMFGGAVNEAPDLTPWPIYIARYISYRLFNDKNLTWSRPDQKVQVSVNYLDDHHIEIEQVIICISHSEDIDISSITSIITERIKTYISDLRSFGTNGWIIDHTIHGILVNPTGKFTIFGPEGDSGQVGRKIVVDQYGGYFAVGGGNLNGKDPTKVDRSAVYMARYVSNLLVSEGYADKVQLQVSYAIGRPEPISIYVDTFGTEHASKIVIDNFVKHYSFEPENIISRFKLNKPALERGFNYKELGMYGHIGTRFTGTFLPWEII
jgi:S-adenosylmethionine synthetase